MGDKQVTKISLSTFLLIIAIIIITIIGFFIYKLNSEKSIKAKKSADSQEQVRNLNSTVSDLQSKKNTNSETVNSSTTTNTSESDDIKYEISKKKNQYGDEVIAVIKATKEGKTTTKEFEMDALITDTGTMILPTIGSVALVAETGGEYYAFKVFRLSEDYTNGKTQEIVEAGTLKYSL